MIDLSYMGGDGRTSALRSVIPTALFLASSACATVGVTMVGEPADTTFSEEEVALYFAMEPLPGDCRRVAILDASAGGAERAALYSKIREKAGAAGANAVQLDFDLFEYPEDGGRALAYACGGHQ